MIGSKVRLREIDKNFTRESDIKRGKFILSWLSKDGSIKQTLAQNPSARRKNFKKLDEALPCLA